MDTMRLGRNDLCRCGSGKKFKKCCLARHPPQVIVAPQPLRRRSLPPASGTRPASDGIPEYVVVKNKGRTHRSELRPGDECRLKDGGWAIYRPDLMNGGSVHVKDKGWIPEGEMKPGDQYELDGVWVTFQPERVIRTTQEHPFFVKDKGWTPLAEIKVGDLIRTEDGWVPVAKIEDTGKWEPVYNLRVADYHTYFVGGEDWGFAVWAHNSYMTDTQLDAWIQAHVQVPADTSPPTGSVRSVVESLPSRSGSGPVSGILVVNGKAYHLASLGGTQPGWSAIITDSTRRFELVGNMGATQDNYRHLEITVALVLRKLKLDGVSISSAVLYENQKPCEYGTQGCHPNMGQMLLSGVQLKVYWPDSKSSYRLGPPGTPEHDQMRVGEVLFRETDYVGGQASPPLRVPGDPGNVVDRNPGQIVPAP